MGRNFTNRVRSRASLPPCPPLAGVLVALGCLVHPAPCGAAQDYTNFELSELADMDVVYGASKYEQKVSEAPSAVTVVTDEDIRDFGYSSLAEILASVRGFYVTSDRNYFYSGVRGFDRPGDYNTRVLILIDGHRINDNVVEQGPISLEAPIDVDLIERVEVIRGPSSSLYGSDALFAVVNVVTRRGSGLDGARVAGTVGSGDLRRSRMIVGSKTTSGVEYLYAGDMLNARGGNLYFPEFDSPTTNNGVFNNGDGEVAERAFAKVRAGSLTFLGNISQREKGIPTAAFGTLFNDSRARTWDTHGYVEMQFERPIAGSGQFLGRVFYDYFEYHGRYPYETPPGSGTIVISEDKQHAEWGGAELRVTSAPWHGHRAIAGLESREDVKTVQAVWDVDPYYEYLNDVRGSGVWAAYVQDEWRLNRVLSLNFGGRYDHYETFAGTGSPRAAIIVAPSQATTFKLLWGQAFRAPSAYELYYGDGYSQKGNLNLTPERMRSYEAVWEQRLTTHLRGSVSAYRYDIRDLITQYLDPADNLVVFLNAGRIESQGIEAEIAGRLAPEVRARVSYAYNDTRDQETDARLSNSPQHVGSVNLRFPLLKGITVGGIELVYMSPRLTLSGGEVPARTLTNLTMTQRVPLPGVEASLSAWNLFDARYSDPGSGEHVQDALPREGRSLRFKISFAR